MKRAKPAHPCECPCHRTLVVHPTPTCDCGKAVTPPTQTCTPPPVKSTCPPPPHRTQPGTVDFPQPNPAPVYYTSVGTAGADTKPDSGPAQILWFKDQVKRTLRDGPSFGPRKDEYLPYLLVRSATADRGRRPFSGIFWESPDIFVVPNQEADTAPPEPATLGSIAQANAPNTLYAHVWNLGRSPSYRVRVEFYWFNPTLGISYADANLIGAAYVDLADRFSTQAQWKPVQKSYGSWLSRGNHAIVPCPTTWTPTFQNGGHECLVVRVLDPLMDAVSPSQFSAAEDRHVCQRNIAVVQASSPASLDLALSLGYADSPADMEVDVVVDAPDTMDWLQLYTRSRAPGFTAPLSPVVAGFLPPSVAAGRLPPLGQISVNDRAKLLHIRERFSRGCCPLQIAFHASIQNLDSMQAQVLRLRQRRGTDIVGGYTVVLLKH